MNDGDNKRKLYDALSKEYDMGTFEQFSTDVEDEGKRKKLYEAIKGEYDLPDFDGFTRQLVGELGQVQQPAATPAQQGERSPYKMAQSNTPTYDYDGQMPPAQRPATPRSKGNTQPTQTAAAQPLGPEKFAKQMQFEHQVRQRVPSPEAMMQDFSQRMENIRKGNQPFGSASEQRYNPETGKMETVYYTKGGDEVASEVDRLQVNRQYDQEQKTRDDVANLSANIDSMLEAARERATEKYKNSDAVRTLTDNDKPWYKKIGAAMITSNAPVQSAAFNTPEVQELTAAQRKLRDAKRIIAEADHNAQRGTFGDWLERSFAGGAARGFAQKATDLDTWDFGITDLLDNVSLMQALDAADKGEQLTESQQALLDATVIEMAVNTYFGSEVGRGYKAGKVTAESIPFMMEMMINPASGVGTSVGAKMTRYALKRFGKQAVKKGGERFLARKGMEIGGRVLGDVLGASTMAATTGSVRTTADAFDRMNNAQMRGEEMGYGEAFSKAFANTTIQNFSEMFGDYFEPLAGVVGGGLTRVATSKVGSKIGLNRVHDFIENVGASDVARIVSDFEKHAKWNGMFSEYAEEVAGGVMNALVVGDQTLDTDPEKGVFNLDQNIDTFLGVSLLGGFMSGVKTVGYRTPKYRARKAMNEADRVCRSAFENEDVNWDAIRATLSTGNVAEVKSVLQDIALNPDYTEEQKLAVMDYANKATAYKGMLIAEQKRRAGGEESDEQLEAEVAFDNGYDADEQSRRDIAIEYSMNPDDEVRTAAFDGVRQRIEDDADDEAEGWREEGRKMMHSDGSIRPAVLKVKNENGEDTEVYIVSGEVVMTADGTMVDRDRTLKANGGSNSIVIYDPATGERRMIDPTSDMGILSIGEATSTEDFEKEIQHRRDEYVQQQLDEVQGTVRVELGQPLTMTNGKEGTVIAISPDGESFTVVANDGSGEQEQMQRSNLQQVADAAALADYQARHQEDEATAEQPTEEETDEPTAVAPGIVEGAPAEFLPDMNITILDDEGNEQPATVIGRVRYDRGNFVPDENGNIVEYLVDGQREHENAAKLAEKVVSHVDATLAAQETAAEQPAAVEQPTVETPTAEVETPAAEPIGETTGTVAEQPTVEPMPMREDGEADFLATTSERGHQFIYNEAGLSQEEAGQFVKANLEMSTKALDKAKKDAPKMGTSLVKYKQQRAEYQAKVDAAQQAVDYWSKVQTIQLQAVVAEREAAEAEAEEKRRKTRQQIEALEKREREEQEAEKAKARQLQKEREKMAATMLELSQQIDEERGIEDIDWPIEQDAEAMEILNDTEPRTLEEVAAQILAKRKTRIDPESYRKHTGYNTTEQRTLPFVFAKPENGGVSMEEFGEMVQEKARDEKIIFDELDANAGMNALLNVLSEVRDFNQLNNYIANARRAEAEEYHSNNVRRAGEAAMEERWIQQHGGMSRDEYNSYISYMEDAVQQGKMAISEEEWNEIFNYENPIQNDTRTAETDERSEQRSTQESGTDEPQAGQAPTTENDTRGDGEEDARPGGEPASPVAAAIAQQEIEENPSEAQKEAGNYKKAHVRFDGYDLTIENKKGSIRSGVDPSGNAWSREMHNNYGYILGTEGVDGDHIDVFLSDTPEEGDVFVVDQVNADGTFDEHKVMYGFPDMESAKAAYLSNYEEGWQGLGAITPVSKEEFKKWIDSSHRKTKPFSEYKSVKTQGDVQIGEGILAKEQDKQVSDEENLPLKKVEDLDSVIEAAPKPQEETVEQPATEQNKSEQPKQEKRKSKWVDEEDADEFERLREQMHQLRGRLNSGMDPMEYAIGVKMGYLVVKHGVHKFRDFAKAMLEELGEWVRPHLKSLYTGILGMEDVNAYRSDLDKFDDVMAFDVYNFDKEGPKDIIGMADHVVKENESMKQKEEAEKKLIDKRKERWQGKKKAEEPATGDKDATKKPKNGEKDVSLQPQMSLFDSGTETETEEEQEAESTLKYSGEQRRKMSNAVTADLLKGLQEGVKPYNSIVDLRRRAKSLGLEVDDEGRDDVALQEMVEDGLVRAARTIVESGKYGGRKSREAYEAICRLYDLQPTISRRSANRVKMQQYSTPLPMAFVADMFAWKPGTNIGLEPTAGNGMLVFGVPAGDVVVNELDKTRLANLQEQGFLDVKNLDALTADFGGLYDFIIANPPFGSAEAKEYDGKEISGLDPQITLNALAAMRDNGRAAIIIGGNMEYAKNGAVSNNKAFWTYLYDHYNVKGVVDMDGKLYAKQGTTYPTRMILIDGRRSEEERAQSTVYPPRKFEAVRKAETFEDLYDIVTEVLNSNKKTNGNEVLRTSSKPIVSNTDNETGRTNESDTGRESNANVGNGSQREPRPTNSGRGERGDRQNEPQRVPETPRESDSGAGQPGNAGVSATQTDNGGRSAGSSEPSGSERTGDTGRVHDDGVRAAGNAAGGVRVEESAAPETAAPQQKEQPKQRTVEDEKLPYRPHNTAFSLESVAPAAMVEAMDNTLSEIERVHGMSIDEFVTSELGYDSIEEMHNALAAEQVDSVAMAIHNMWGGNAMIIGDQTGVGKGRQMAALIRWACKQGKKPIFITQKADLFSDIYRDLVDVGSGDLRPFIFNSDGAMVDANGNVVHKPLSSAAQAKVFAGETLPDDYDFAVLTYSQVNTGDEVSREFAKQHKGKDQRGSKQSKAVKNGKATPKATFLRKIAQDNYLFLDESHTAAGDSNVGAYIRSIIGTKAGAVIGNAGGAVEGGVKGVTFASATFAKRPDTMPMYAMRTAMSEANVKPEELIKIIEKGGVTLQEIMSRALTDSGQMVRRERDMSDVRTDWETISDPATVKRARENYDRTIAAFNAIIDFQDTYVKPLIAAKDAEVSIYAESAGVKKGTDKMGVENVPFASKTYNYTKQLMLALKVDAIADRVESEIKAGRHPVIALESTMEASIKDYTNGDVIDEPTFSASLLRGLDTVMQYTVKDADGKETHHHYKPSDLGREGEAAYYALQNAIRENTSDIFISPLDAIIEKLHEKGYKVGELTGRNNYVERDAQGRVVVRRRTDKDKKRMQREFNSGALDVLILNKSASTGISLHASKTFSDQRQRTMIIAQPLSDINDYMQMIGRIDRTGQVHRGYYINLGLPVPAESRFLMMLSTKLKSLNANTTTSQDSEDNSVEAPDLLNKYGSQVVVEYLRDNPNIYEKMGEPLRKGMGEKVSASELDEYKAPASDEVARKITGYVALLTTQEQEDFYNDVVRRYTDLIKYLDSTGTNDLKITVMPLKAKTLRKGVSSKGNNPNGSNPFAQDAYVEEVEMDVLRKPMKAEEIRSGMETLNKLHGTEKGHLRSASEEKIHGERVLEIMGVVQRDEDARLQAEEERYKGSKARLTENVGKKRDAISKQNRSEEEKAEALKKYVDEETKKIEERHEANVNKARSLTYFMREGLTNYITGRTYFLPQDLTEEGSQAGMFKVPAIFMGYKVKDEKPTPSTSFAVFATLDGRRRVEVKFTDNQTNKTIDFLTNSDYNEAQRTTLDNWDSKIPSETRKKGYIMTGNILQAVADTQDEMGNYKGQLISYTDEQGDIHDGILMPDRWEPSMLKTSGVPINAKLGEILRGGHVESGDGKVKISSNGNGNATLTVPKTKKEGAKYYENPVILQAIDSYGFWQNRGEFQADIIGESNIRKVVAELLQMGVRVRDEQADNNLLSRGVSDEERIAELESQPKMKMYRSMVLIDGKLYPPMSSKEADGKGLREPSEIGKWEESEEAPEKAVLRNGKWVFPLKKDNGKSLYAAYNPYIHTSATMLNDQFSEAQNRENLVVVEMEVPMSEMTSGYQAEKAKDSVGMKQWKAGVIQGQLNGTREVMLSRWAKPIRIVPTEEVAENIAKQIDGIITVMPSNVVTPQVREAMEKLGVKFVETDNTGKLKEGANKGRSWTSVYGKGKSVQKLMREGETEAVELEHPSEYADWMEQLWYTMPERWFDIQRGTMAYEDGVKMSKLRGYSKKRYDNMLERAEDSFKKQVMQTAERMNIGDRVQVVATADEITDEKLTEKQKSDKALYSPTSDKIYIILGNHRNMDDVMKSLLHESVAHHGLRELFGDHFDTFLDNVYAGSEESIREKIASMAAKHGWNVRTATEEYLAQMAETMDFEKPENNSWWSKVKTWFFDMLHKIGFTVKNWPGTITDNELAYVLWRSYQNMVNPGRYRSPIEIAEDTVMQDKLEVGQFESVKAKTLVRRLMVAAEGREDAYDTMLKYIEEKMIDAKTDSEALAVLNEAKELNDVVWDESEKNASKKALDNLEGMHQALVPFIDFHTQEFEEAGLIAAETNGLLSRDGDFSPRDNAIARDYYERMVSQNGYQVQEAMQDSMLGLRKAMQAILGAGKDFKIEEVAGNENAYLAENRMSSTNAAEQHNYFRQWLEPLLKAVHEIAGSKTAEREALTNYMMAKHGLERNEKFAERDFVAYQQQYPTGGKTLADFRQNDYAGLTALTGEQDVVDAESVAQQMVADYEAQHDTSELWDAVNTATKVTLAKMYRGGLMSKDSYEHTRDMFEYYIPLRGFDETTSDEVYGYLTSRQGPLGSSILKHAEGRRSKADDPIATIAMMADQAIMQANRNEMKQRFLTFVQNHPSDLVSVSKLWLQYDAAADEWVPVFADIDEGDTAADVARKVEAFEQRMEQLAANDPDNYKSGKEAASIPYRVLPGNMNEHQVLVKRAGETFVLTINGNPRAAQALNGLTNPDVKTGGFIGGFMKASSTVNRFLSSAYTTRTPDFVVSNFFRDMLYSNCMAWVKDTPSYALRFHKNFGRFNPVTMRVLFGKWENGKLDDSKPIEYMFKQFMMNGGETGYTNVRDIEAQKRRIVKELRRQGSAPRKVLHVLGEQLDLVNQAVENCARFAAFITSQELGRSLERSIYDAKEVSVNFNKKGSGDKMMGAEGQTKIGNVAAFLGGAGRCLQVFWNAGVQGMTNFGRAAKRKPGKFVAASATMFTLGAVIPLIAKALAGDGDDDDKNAYYNLPEYVRRSNICFRVGDQWITIPLPIEFRAIYGLGELGTGVITGEEHYSDDELARQMVAQVSQILPLDFMEGQGGLHNLWPSWAKPIVEAHNNKGWTGLPIYRDTPFNQSDPEFTKVYKSADKHIVAASKWLNDLTGGDDYKKGWADVVNPAQVEYVLNGYFGGYFKVPNQLIKMTETATGNREFEWRNMMIANRLVKSGDERTAHRKLQNEYFKYKEEYEETERLKKKYEKAADEGVVGYAEKVNFLNNSDEYARYLIFDEYKKDIKDLYDLQKEEADEELRKEYEAEYYQVMREMVDAMHEYERSKGK